MARTPRRPRNPVGWWRIEAGPLTGSTSFSYYWDTKQRVTAYVAKLRTEYRGSLFVATYLGPDTPHRKTGACRVPKDIRANKHAAKVPLD